MARAAEGEFRNETIEGFGTCTFASGDRYEGEIREGRQDGKGTYFLPTVNRYRAFGVMADTLTTEHR